MAQETVNQASISGRVVDSQGAVVPGAVVTARHTDTNLAAETATDQAGRFRFPYLQSWTLRDHRPAGRIRGRQADADVDGQLRPSRCLSCWPLQA